MSQSTRPLHAQPRLGRLTAVAALLLGAILVALPSGRAAAVPCDPTRQTCGGGGDQQYTFTSMLTVSTPTTGTVTSSPAGIACPGTCTRKDTLVNDVNVRPTDGWTTYALTASGGRAGFAPVWSGCDSLSGDACIVTNDAIESVSLDWHDIQAPTVAIALPSGQKVGPSVTVAANAGDNDGVARVDFLVDGVQRASDTSVPYSAVLSLGGYADGSQHVITARAFDASGNAAAATRTVTLDKNVTVSIGSPASDDVVTTKAPVSVPITTDSDASAACTFSGIPDSTPVPCTHGYLIAAMPELPDGSYVVTAKATDDVDNTSTATRSLVVDNTAPSLRVTGPADGARTYDSGVTMAIASADPHGVSLACTYDGAARPCAQAKPVALAVSPGSHVFSVQATDEVGNTRSSTMHFTRLAKTATHLTARAARKHGKRNQRMAISARVTPAGTAGTVVFTRAGRTLCTATLHGGTASCRTAKLPRGTYRVIAHYLGDRGHLATTARFSFRVG